MRRRAGLLIALFAPMVAAAAPADRRLSALQDVVNRFRAGEIVKQARSPQEAANQLALLHALNASVRDQIQNLERKGATGTPLGSTPPAAASPIAASNERIVDLLPPVSRPAGVEQMAAGPALYIPTALNAPVRAGCSGAVLYAGQFRSYGELAILDCGNTIKLVLGGLAQINVQAGRLVRRGQVIGKMPHDSGPPPRLYVEVREGEQPVDPRNFFHKAGKDSSRHKGG